MLLALTIIFGILATLWAVSYAIQGVNGATATIATLFQNSTYYSGTWLINGTQLQQVSTTPTNQFILRVAQGSFAYISNSTWSMEVSNNGDNGPIFSPYAQFNLTPGYYKIRLPQGMYDYEQPVYSFLDKFGPLITIIAGGILIIVVLTYTKLR
jgi:hypothetical protein